MNNYEEKIKALNRKLKIMSEQIKTLEKKYRALTETTVDAIVSTNSEGHIIFCNPSAEKMFGYADEIIGKFSTILIPERYRLAHLEGIKRYLNTGKPKIIGKTVEVIGLRKDSTEFPIELSLSAWENKTQCYFTAIIRDITERKRFERDLMEANKKLEELSTKDSLTNLYNRRYADKILEIEFNQAKRYQMPLSCLMIDIDYFKKINDTYGHRMGDKAIIHVSNILLEMTRTSDIVARYGGEEFIVILTNTDTNGAVSFAERLRESVSKYKIKDTKKNITIGLTVSIGVGAVTENTKNKEELVNLIDRALYNAKQQGRNRVCCYIN